MQPSIGRIVIFKLTEGQKDEIVARRAIEGGTAATLVGGKFAANSTGKVFIGNPIELADEVPLIIVRVWPHEFGENIPGVNGQAILDGNDSFWVLSAKEGTEPGTWHWPERV